MVCSACGFENQSGMRFCGMCGTPLPHRPLTAPGAQSTLNLTRVPLENSSASAQQGTVAASTHSSVSESSTGEAGRTASAVDTAPRVQEAPPKELVPDIPLDEYLRKFRYEPPKDSAELTMRGDAAPAIDPEAPLVQAQAPRPPMPVTATHRATTVDAPPVHGNDAGPVSVSRTKPDVPVESRPPARTPTPPAPADTAITRLGLDPSGPAEEPAPRPRFLDIAEASAGEKARNSGTSTIVGPSFLGLSDAPTSDASDVPAYDTDEAPRQSHWRGRLALAVILIFGVLGFMEWRSQRHQGGVSPLQVIRAKWSSWRNGGEPQSSQTASTSTNPSDTNSQPGAQVPQQPPTQAQNANPSGTDVSSLLQNATPPPPGAQAGSPSDILSTTRNPSPSAANAATQPQGASADAGNPSSQATAGSETRPASAEQPASNLTAADNSKAAKSDLSKARAATKADSPKLARKAADNGDVTAASGQAAGSEEMTKAKNASDSAATAAWLWKATAKGNPDAPVQLADMYIKGNGVPRSCEQAMVLLKTAAAKENALARNRLASMYATGNCVQRNRVEAYRWLSSALAANPDSQWAQQNRDLIWRQMTPEEQAQAQRYR